MRKLFLAIGLLLPLIGHGAQAETSGNLPPKFAIPWGNSAGAPAYIRPIPQSSQIGIQNCAASLTDGFPPLTFIAQSAGGCPPFGQDFNGILQQLSKWSRWNGMGTPVFYDSAFSAAIGGYPEWAALAVLAAPGCSWVSKVNANSSNPDTGGANWQNTCALGGVLTGTTQNAGLAPSGVTAGTYVAPTVTLGADGRVTAASNGSGAADPTNLGFSASAAANALTINLTTAAGLTPTASSPVVIPFRSTTLATGTAVQTVVSGATSITIPSGATLGTVNATAFRIWIFATYHAGSPQLGVAKCSVGTTTAATIFPCTSWETALNSPTAISAGATSAGVLYATAAVTNDAIHILGYCEYTTGLTVAGTWASACTTLHVLDAGTKKPGDTVQTIMSAPTNGVTGMTLAITPTSAANLVNASASLICDSASSTINSVTVALERGATTLRTQIAQLNSSGGVVTYQNFTPMSMVFLDFPATTAATPYSLVSNSGCGSGFTYPTIILNEIMGAMEPANDDDASLRKAG